MTTPAVPQASPSPSVSPSHPVSASLAQRLTAVLPVLAPDRPEALTGLPTRPELIASVLLEVLVEEVALQADPDRVWLLLTAVTGCYPTVESVDQARMIMELGGPTEVAIWLLRHALREPPPGAAARELELVIGAVLVEVGHTAVSDLHTGVQQVVRQVMPRWHRDRSVILAGWWPGGAGLRRLAPDEEDRVLRWPGAAGCAGTVGAVVPARDTRLLVPWRSVVVFPDVAGVDELERLVAVARFSGTHVVGLGHDCIPVVSGDLVPPGAAGSFVRFLELVKWMRRLAAVSESAAREFRGFCEMLPTQGLIGPVVTVCPEASERPDGYVPAPDGLPLVAVVSSYEPRKNHLAVLDAAERLWREGLVFELRLVGGMSWHPETQERIAELQAAGRALQARVAVDDAELAHTYRAARFTVLVSLHEGYGLPVAESLAAGTPVLTTDYGSTAEVAAAGGALLVDPRDDDAVLSGMRLLLTDDAEVERLRRAAAARPARSWEDVAADLWEQLVAPGVAR